MRATRPVAIAHSSRCCSSLALLASRRRRRRTPGSKGRARPGGGGEAASRRAVVFSFDEPVEGNFGAVRVYDAKGERVDEGDAFHPGGEGPKLGVHLKPGLPDGSYTATYRVVSADGHIVSSGYVFSIGKAGRAPTETVAELIGGSGSGPVTETAYGLARGLEYAAIALAVGGLAFLLSAGCPALGARAGVGDESRRSGGRPPSPARLRLVLWVAAALGALAAAAQIVLEGAEAAGISGFSALKVDRRRDPGDQLRHRLGLRLPRLGRLRGGAAAAPAATAAPASALAIPLAYLVLARRSAATAPPSPRSSSTSRSTSSTSARWRSGSAAWRAAPGPAGRDPRRRRRRRPQPPPRRPARPLLGSSPWRWSR